MAEGKGRAGRRRAAERVRTRHDELRKRALSLWFRGMGEVEIDARVAGESRRGDVLYTEGRGAEAQRRRLGVLGDLARGRVLFELFYNPPTPFDLRSCVLKGVDLEARDRRAARRARRPLGDVQGPALCVITPTLSAELRAGAAASPVEGGAHGLYAMPSLWRTVVVVVHELPGERATLWLRLLGRGEVQAQAVRELLELTDRDPLRDATMHLLVAWQQSLPPPAQQSEEEQELRMNWEQAYERWEKKVTTAAMARGRAEGKAEGKAEGRAEGRAEGKAEAVLAVLESRGIAVTAAERKRVLGCEDAAQLDAWLRAAVTIDSAATLLSDRPARRAPEGGAAASVKRRPVRRARPSRR